MTYPTGLISIDSARERAGGHGRDSSPDSDVTRNGA
jgi:hypothetical protein